jgi:hypothetical protein
VGRPPQELMRGWGRLPICMDSIADNRLEIRATRNLTGKDKKGKHGGGQKGKSTKSEEMRDETLRFKEKL